MDSAVKNYTDKWVFEIAIPFKTFVIKEGFRGGALTLAHDI